MSDAPDSTSNVPDHPLASNGTVNRSDLFTGTENQHNNDDDKISSTAEPSTKKKNWIKFENDEEQPSSSSMSSSNGPAQVSHHFFLAVGFIAAGTLALVIHFVLFLCTLARCHTQRVAYQSTTMASACCYCGASAL